MIEQFKYIRDKYELIKGYKVDFIKDNYELINKIDIRYTNKVKAFVEKNNLDILFKLIFLITTTEKRFFKDDLFIIILNLYINTCNVAILNNTGIRHFNRKYYNFFFPKQNGEYNFYLEGSYYYEMLEYI